MRSFYFFKTPRLIQQVFKNYRWSFYSSKKVIYLTFDDGPTAEITEWTLNILKEFDAKATFFCIGKNVENHPKIFSQIISGQHSVGNHTNNHLNGWKSATITYVKNIEKAAHSIQSSNSKLLFRPPYGKIKPSQAKKIRENGYEIILWDVLSADFDKKISKETCLKNVLKNTKKGSIIVFHDSVKASEHLKYVLPKVLAYFTKKGYEFKGI